MILSRAAPHLCGETLRHFSFRSCLASLAILLVALFLAGACRQGRGSAGPAPTAASRSPLPVILLVTLDTTRADAIGPDASGIVTPGFNAVAQRGRRFRQAYAAAPETLPSHVSMMTGLYPGGHGIHENGRTVSAADGLLAERLRKAGYRTAAFVSSFILAKRFGLDRGFDVYDDELPAGSSERSARATTDAALAMLAQAPSKPLFLWVHYFEPHYPYEPPEPFRSQYRQQPYLGEVAAMDEQLARLVTAVDQKAGGQAAVVIVGDHGEGLGEHGEARHGNLLYQATVRVPLVVAAPGIGVSVNDDAVSTRRVFDTVLDWAGLPAPRSLLTQDREVVLGEAMKPFLEYGWQPQVMAIAGREKSILSGRVETFDVVADPGETHDLARDAARRSSPPAALRDYPVPAPGEESSTANLDAEARRRLASLGYVSGGAVPVVRKEAPRAADMTPLFDLIEKASGLFTAGQYAAVIPLLERILAQDPQNLDATLRLATAHSSLGHDRPALDAFEKAARLAPNSLDVQMYLALHYARGRDWERAVPLLEQVVAKSPTRVAALEGLAAVRERQGRLDEALELRQKIYQLRPPTAGELGQLGELAMRVERTPVAIDAFERERALKGPAFPHDLELGVLYLAERRFADARAALDRVPPSHPAYAMALFKRAQVSVLLNEPDKAARIAAARSRADATTRELIARERLFQR